jgi:RelE-like HigB toxin of type II HigAB toxin-antitoxin system
MCSPSPAPQAPVFAGYEIYFSAEQLANDRTRLQCRSGIAVQAERNLLPVVFRRFRQDREYLRAGPDAVPRAIEFAPLVLNIKGNDYRLISVVRYSHDVLMIRFFGSHEDYDKVDAETV